MGAPARSWRPVFPLHQVNDDSKAQSFLQHPESSFHCPALPKSVLPWALWVPRDHGESFELPTGSLALGGVKCPLGHLSRSLGNCGDVGCLGGPLAVVRGLLSNNS